MRTKWSRPARETMPVRARCILRVEALEERQVLSGFQTLAPSYITPLAPGSEVTPLVTVGDSVDGYTMAGIPDGIGAFDNGDGTFTVLVNHEIPAGQGVVRAHGQRGAFVSKWVIDKDTLEVLSGSDLIQDVVFSTGTEELSRLCSADLPALTALFNPRTGRGTRERLLFHGEEIGAEGRDFATQVSTGVAFELPHLGKLSYENTLANPFAQDKTFVISTDDSTPGQVYVYIGTKTRTGTAVERAGLTNGNLFGVAVDGVTDEDRAAGIGATSKRFRLAALGDVSGKTGAQLQADSEAAGVTEFLRPEDGAWDPNNPRDFYFVTTDRFDTIKDPGTPAGQVGRSRLWRLRFDSVTNPEAGGTITLLLDGTEPQQMFDNMTLDREGHILIQEDPGNQVHVAKIWQYDIASGDLVLLAEHNRDLFLNNGQAGFLTQDEESSGILDISHILGRGHYVLDVQPHFPNGPELVEGGQLLILNTNVPRAKLEDGVLTVQGTVSDDLLSVNRLGRNLVVFGNGERLGQFDARDVDQIQIDGFSGADDIFVGLFVTTATIANGGLGNDVIVGGSGDDVLVGGEGSDLLVGGFGKDILIGGTTDFDDDADARQQILETWSTTPDYEDAVDALRPTLNDTTVHDDGDADLLLGLFGRDWFFAGLGDLTDRNSSEFLN